MSTPLRSVPREQSAGEASDVPELAEAVTEAARGLRYGSIEVVIHDARIVQIIRTEKRRIER
jgi:hypothetical protein